jgi:type IV pilus assembly protein PilE
MKDRTHQREIAPMAHHPAMRSQSGMTLMELMIVVAIVGILMSIAVPGYREYMRRGAVEEGLATLSSTRTAMEQYFLDNRTYVGAPDPPDTKEFAITVAGDANSYTLTATGSGRVQGFVYTLDETGARTSAGPWGSGNCWVGRKGESCGGGS